MTYAQGIPTALAAQVEALFTGPGIPANAMYLVAHRKLTEDEFQFPYMIQP